MFKFSYRDVIDTLLKIAIASGVGFSTASAVNFANYISYWHKTLPRVQTVDFNILSHMLPTKLSYALQLNNSEELQSTLNSNYGFFGMVVTDCKTTLKNCRTQRILYASQGKTDYKKAIQSEELLQHPFDLLQNPPPLLTESLYTNPRALKRDTTGRKNKGEIIGRVYYVRGVPPSFISDYTRWLENPLKDSGANRLYSLTVVLFTVGGFFGLSFVENRKLQAQHQLLQTEHKLMRLRGYFVGFQETINQDVSSVIANRLQELKGILSRINTDIANIVHDMGKAPLIGMPSNIPNRIMTRVDIDKSKLSEDEVHDILSNVNSYMQQADKTISTISWVIDDLNEVANLEPEAINVQEVIESFKDNLPPSLKQDWLHVEFSEDVTEPLWIMCNSWHLRSIIKNALYNSENSCSKVMTNYLLNEPECNYEGKIKVACSRINNNAAISVIDNGTGLNSEAFERLYQSHEKVNTTGESVRGKGSIIVNSYIMLHNGSVELSNISEGGAKITFLFPLVPAPNNK